MPSSLLLLFTSVVKLPLISVEAELAATVLHIRVLHFEGGVVQLSFRGFLKVLHEPEVRQAARNN